MRYGHPAPLIGRRNRLTHTVASGRRRVALQLAGCVSGVITSLGASLPLTVSAAIPYGESLPAVSSGRLWVRVALDPRLHHNGSANLTVQSNDERGIATYLAIALRSEAKSSAFAPIKNLKISAVAETNPQWRFTKSDICANNKLIVFSVEARRINASNGEVRVTRLGCRTSTIVHREAFNLIYPHGEGNAGDAWGGATRRIGRSASNILGSIAP